MKWIKEAIQKNNKSPGMMPFEDKDSETPKL